MEEVIRVLLVEDDPAARTMMEALLAPIPELEVCALARDGLEGLEALDREQPDAVLLDLVMPGLDGLGFLQKLKEPGHPKAVVVVLSCISSQNIIQYALSLGAAYYLIKPLNYHSVPDLLRSLCGETVEQTARRLLAEMGGTGLAAAEASSAAAELAKDRRGRMKLKEAYAPFMVRARTSYGCIEKNIRDLTSKLQAEAHPVYQAIMGGMPEKRPSNRVFLRHLAQAVLERRAEKTTD